MPRQIGIGHLNCQFYDLAFFYSLLSPIDSLFFWPSGQKNRGDRIRTYDPLVPKKLLPNAKSL